MKRSVLLCFALLLLCGCQPKEAAAFDPQSAVEPAQNWIESLELENGSLFAADLDLSGEPELYLLWGDGEYDNQIVGMDCSDGSLVTGLPMGKPADENWWVALCYNEDFAYVSIDTKVFACSADGESNPSHIQHNISMKKGVLSDFTVFVNQGADGSSSYVIDGKIITDPHEYDQTMKDYRLQDAEGGSIDCYSYEGDPSEAILAALNDWNEEFGK